MDAFSGPYSAILEGKNWLHRVETLDTGVSRSGVIPIAYNIGKWN
jgi:hypothetical protein